MTRNTRINKSIYFVCFALAALAGCGGGEDVSTRNLSKAHRLWDRAGIADYDLEWTSSGARSGHYFVVVRDGSVQSVSFVNPDGSRKPAHPGDVQYYGVDGLFRTIEEDAESCVERLKSGSNKGVRVLLKFWPDERLGYPRRYRRDVTNAIGTLAIDVVGFTPRDGNQTPEVPAATTKDPG